MIISRFPLLSMLVLAALLWALPAPAQKQNPDAELARVVEQALTQECIGDVLGAEATWARVAETGEKLLAAKPTNTFYLLTTARALYGQDDFQGAAAAYERFESVMQTYKVDTVKDYPWVLVYQGLTQARLGRSQSMVDIWEQTPASLGRVRQTLLTEISALPPHPSCQDLNAAAGRVESVLLQSQAQTLGGPKPPLLVVGGVGQGLGPGVEEVQARSDDGSGPSVDFDPEGMGGSIMYGVTF